jgi:stage V sporulation protein D (sporulation-specific penicillin-binding protein)
MVGNYITSFIGFLPADDPEIVLYIAIDNAKGVTQYGSTVAAPVAKSVLSSAISALNIEKRTDDLDKKYNYTDKQYAVVPNVVGQSTKDALSNLKQFKVEFTGSGDIIKYQSPSEGTTLFEGDTIRLMLGE